MIKVDVSIVINRPVETVFAFMTDHRNDVRWQDGLLEVRQTPNGPADVGTLVTEVRKFMGRRIETTGEITELIPNVKSVRRTVNGPMEVNGYLAFESVSGGTRVTHHMEMQTKGFFTLADPLVAGNLRRSLAATLSDAKDLLENSIVGIESEQMS
jgi:uncharacterized membrane protein